MRYVAFGLRISSELPLPELTRWPDAADWAPDITIRLESLAGEDAADAFTYTIRNVARYRVRGGREIAVDRFPGAPEREVRLFVLGSALGLVCHQRRLLPLHANAVVIGGVAVAFAGRRGIGKSTLAAHFERRGYEVLCDDVCVVSQDESGRPMVWPGLPRLKLWRDAAEAFGHDRDTLEPARDGIEKYCVPLREPAGQRPYPLARLYILSDHPGGTAAAICRIPGMGATQAIIANTYRHEYLGAMGLASANFSLATSVARQIPVFSAPRERGYGVFDREAERLERHVLGAEGATAERVLPARTERMAISAGGSKV